MKSLRKYLLVFVNLNKENIAISERDASIIADFNMKNLIAFSLSNMYKI